ncbi:multidrug resistance-associated protein, partial [Asbolus verrucosus]
MLPIFKHSFKKGLSEEDLFEPLDEHKSSILGDKLQTIWEEEHRKHKNVGLYKALIKLFGLNFILYGLVRLVDEIILVVVMPISIGNLVTFFEKGQTQISEVEAYIYAGVIVFCRIADSVMCHATMMALAHLSMKMRVACSSLIYRKILKLNRTALADTTIGQVVNLLSNDVSKFDQGFVLANFAWIAPIQAAVGTYLLYDEIGVSAFFGMALLLSFIPLQAWFGKKCSSLRLEIALKTDTRVRLMNEVISGIQVIKMYCWEKPFGHLISLVRRFNLNFNAYFHLTTVFFRQEMKGIRSRGYLLGLVYCFEMFITRVSIFVSILGYILLGQFITAKKMFVMIAIYAVLRPIITTIFSLGINSIAEVYVSVQRIQTFLSLEEQKLEEFVKLQPNGLSPVKTTMGKPRISLNNVSAKWSDDCVENTLEGINLDVTTNQVVAVIGPVGSGKSSLFNVFLRELPIKSGTMNINGRISYSSQEPWLFSASVRQNILFGNEYDEERYQQVVEMCALKSDFELLPYGDKTLVGERGKALSGGQKARINLARCIYKEADIYLLDDPLSAVDANVGKHLYERCIKEFLRGKICVLITHQLQYLSSVDKIVVMEDGEIEMEGQYTQLQTSGLDFTKLLGQLHVGEEKIEEENRKTEEQKIKSMEDPLTNEDECSEDGPLLESENMKSGSVKSSLYLSYFKSGGGYYNAALMLILFIGAQVVANASDYYVTYWANTQQDFEEKVLNNLTKDNETFPRDDMLYTYSEIILAVVIFGVAHGLYFMFFFAVASTTLHRISFSRILKATMHFYNRNPSGRILNRFSKDLGNIDEYIPEIMYDVIAVALDLFGAIILSAVVDVWLCLPAVVLLLAFYSFRRVYIETSRSVKRIEGIARSPIYTHMSASMHGLSTIRAFSAQRVLTEEFDAYQDRHSAAWFLFLASNRCFGFWLDMMCAVFIAVAAFLLLYFNESLYGGDIGLVITQFIGLAGGLQWGMRQWSELENQMVSLERLLEYSKVETEPEREELTKMPKNWPENGQIEFRDVSLRYDPTDPFVLKNLNFTIRPREKIGIVGRTGAGKSSTITALFQLYPIEGSIIIDGVDTTKLPLEQVRSKISIIPQEPVLFSGTMRKNLDPFEEYNDDILWNALEQVEMKDVVDELPDGLHSYVSEGGSNFSVGQRQLVCLARALIRNNKILVMDEATANVDPYTDALIQNTIRDKFAECTVLTIAHRLHTVMDANRIMVMSAGTVEEFDHPYNLLKNKDGILYNLVQTTGKITALNLENIAREVIFSIIVVTPFSTGRVIQFFEKGQTQVSEFEAWSHAFIIVLCRLFDFIVGHQTVIDLIHLTMQMKSALSGFTVGQIINLISNDLSKFDQYFPTANLVWITPILITIGTYLLYQQIGVSAFYGVVILVSPTPVQGIQMIKMYCWENFFSKLILVVRRKELKTILMRLSFIGFLLNLSHFTTRLSIFVSILAEMLRGRPITAEKIFVVITIFSILRRSITNQFNIALTSTAEIYVSLKRIQKFLSLEEQIIDATATVHQESESKSSIFLKNVSGGWSESHILKNINFCITSNQHATVIGPVGSGKSSLFHVILKEMNLKSGSLDVNGEISYCSQEPWFFSGTIRDNIVFNSKFDAERYQRVVEICALISDFKRFPYGDNTLVGDKGRSLSGGQKARLNMARCLYKEADIYLLDDPLSAVDSRVGNHLYENCIKNFLKHKICILITHQLQYLTGTDRIVIMEDGKIVTEGQYNELQEKGVNFARLLANFRDKREIEDNMEVKSRPNSEYNEESPVVQEEMTKDDIRLSLYMSYFKRGGGFINMLCLFFVLICAQLLCSGVDYYVTYL